MQHRKIILLRETMLESIVKDFWSILTLAGLFWFNYNYIGGSYFVNFLIVVMIMLKVISKFGSFKPLSVQEAREYLDSVERERE